MLLLMYLTFVLYIPEDDHIFGQSVDVHFIYKLVSIYLCLFVGTIIVYIQIMHGLWII